MAVVRDIFALTKPRIILLLVITCVAGMLVATKGNVDLLNFSIIFLTPLGLALTAGGANAINMWYDKDIDAIMSRTKLRPIPAGRLSPQVVLCAGGVMFVLGAALLAFFVNFWAAGMAAAGGLFYVFIYTMLLKRRTVQNIVIGGAAGSFPPVVGWAAVQNSISDPLPWVMFTIIFLWTPPHFWALALKVNKDYTQAKIPMLPVVKGEAETKAQIVYYTVALLAASLAAGLLPPLGYIYTLAALALGGWWLWHTLKLMYAPGIGHAPYVFKLSLYYLAFLFAAMVGDTFL